MDGRTGKPARLEIDGHEAIKKLQFQAADAYVKRKPSEVTETYWIYSQRKKGKYPAATPRGGKWLIFVRDENVDEVWAMIKSATEAGKLGDSSKVATAKPNRLAENPHTRVICVYTYDWTDEKDVRRVREELRNLGITWKISYKADQDTLDGRYRAAGKTRISKYYE